MQKNYILLQLYKLIAMERLRYKQSGKGIGHILDVITIARPWSLRLRRTPLITIINKTITPLKNDPMIGIGK